MRLTQASIIFLFDYVKTLGTITQTVIRQTLISLYNSTGKASKLDLVSVLQQPQGRISWNDAFQRVETITN